MCSQPEGVGIGKHTSFLLDLKNRAVDHKFLNILTDQSPEVPYATWRRFVYGSPQATVTVSGQSTGYSYSLRSVCKLQLQSQVTQQISTCYVRTLYTPQAIESDPLVRLF